MTELEEFLDEARVSGSEFIGVVDDNDPQPMIYLSNAYDGSSYGTPGFADEEGNVIPDDIISKAWWPEEGESTGLLTDYERTEERIRHEEERQESIRREASRIRTANTKRNRRIMEEHYERTFGEKPVKMTMKSMRDAINAKNAQTSLASIGAIMKGFGF